MTSYVSIGDLRVARSLYELVRDAIAPGTGVDPDAVWKSLGEIVKARPDPA